MEKWLCLGSMGVAGVLLLVFIMDLFMGIPFASNAPADKGNPFVMVDICGILAAGLVGYLGFNAFRDVR